MKITDYGNSYVTWTGIVDKNDTRKPGHMPWPNTVRILLDSRCWITDDLGEVREYNMLSPCRTEWMYRSDVLWHLPNYEFAGIYSATEWMAGHIKAGGRQRVWRRLARVAPHRGPVQRAQDRRSALPEGTKAGEPSTGRGSHP